ncbi:MAG: CHASE domain-containing protein, partial [Rhodoferax sp.]|nr:CHASE domain-containing protein [Rhodoferax sp.]
MLVSGLVFLLSVAISAGLLRWAQDSKVAEKRQQAFNLASGYSQLLQRNVERMYSNNYALAAMVGQGNGSVVNFEAAAAQILLSNPLALRLSISPGGIVQSVAPLLGNEKLLGFDQLNDPLQKGETVFARDTGRLTLTGPVELVQGGLGVVSRLPVFLDDIAGQKRFWGFTNVSMRLSELLSGVALSGLAARGYHYELWRLQVDNGEKQTIAASSSSMDSPVRQSLEVPNGAWNLDIAPVNGWHDPQLVGWGAAAGGVASLLMAYLAWLLVQQRRYKAGLETQVAQRTAEIFATQNQLKSTLDAIRDPIFELGLDGRYYQCSAPADELLVALGGTLIGKTVPEVLPEAAAQVVMEALRTAHVEGYSQGQQYALKLTPGVRWFELSVARKAVEAGHEPRFVVMSRDITERKTAEQEIRRLAFYDPLT